jgi:hypothetical protein
MRLRSSPEERYVYSGGVLLQVLAAFGAEDRDEVLTLVPKPRQRKRFESARRLSRFGVDKPNTWKTESSRNGS